MTPSVGSDEAQYAPSSRDGSSPGSGGEQFDFYEDSSDPEVYSPVDSNTKPTELSDPGVEPKPVVIQEGMVENVVIAPASIRSSGGHPICQPVEGRPVRGALTIKVVDRTAPSINAFAVFDLTLTVKADIKLMLDDLIGTLRKRGMEPFYFRKIDFVIFGCRDFIFNSAAEFIDKDYTDGMVKKEKKHIFELLGWRYAKPEDQTSHVLLKSNREVSCFENPVDRAVWPKGFIAHVDKENRIKFNQTA
ncbi:hypothetical protein BJ322DRAFT_1024514 [Thelephora terrestris]|uniref:Uncharacterized protein n=1 Tax=Thelephora terrestris TaxID=56493 RepID=A0A9P6L2F5_9AGAM|nr:hypothetical protein BJ322DRAFT_1024514 [Thelephora terrestris]